MSALPIKIVNCSSNPIPSYATEASAGMDIRAALSSPVELAPGERKLFPTGLFIELPIGYEAQVRPRSGLALKQGITCLNSPGTIDADYRGEIGVILINHSNQTQVIHPGDRIAQLVIHPVVSCSWVPVSELNDSTRGQGGFGHTGVK
ncbi:MAG: dUTP diphosphatase [Bacteroidetes bacterium]|nr:dUTP diphosphatase [Bacteroidota bacterium]